MEVSVECNFNKSVNSRGWFFVTFFFSLKKNLSNRFKQKLGKLVHKLLNCRLTTSLFQWGNWPVAGFEVNEGFGIGSYQPKTPRTPSEVYTIWCSIGRQVKEKKQQQQQETNKTNRK